MEIFGLKEQNPYWETPERITEDLHLKILSTLPIQIVHPIEKKINLNEDGIFIIRGPRQIGKRFLKVPV